MFLGGRRLRNASVSHRFLFGARQIGSGPDDARAVRRRRRAGRRRRVHQTGVGSGRARPVGHLRRRPPQGRGAPPVQLGLPSAGFHSAHLISLSNRMTLVPFFVYVSHFFIYILLGSQFQKKSFFFQVQPLFSMQRNVGP